MKNEPDNSNVLGISESDAMSWVRVLAGNTCTDDLVRALWFVLREEQVITVSHVDGYICHEISDEGLTKYLEQAERRLA